MDLDNQEEFTDDNASNGEEVLDDNVGSERDNEENYDEEFEVSNMNNHAAALERLQNAGDNLAEGLFDEIQKTIKLIASDSSEETKRIVEKLILDYDKLKNVISESREQNIELLQKATQMSNNMVSANHKIQKMAKSAAETKEELRNARKELKKAWGIVESNAEKDSKTKLMIAELKEENIFLKGIYGETTAVATSPSSRGKAKMITLEQEEEIKNLLIERRDLETRCVSLENENKSLSSELEEERIRNQNMIKDRQYADEEMLTLKEYLAVKKSEFEREVRIREKYELQLRQMTESNDKKEAEIKLKIDETKSLKELLLKTEVQLQGEQGRCEKIENERDAVYSQHSRLQNDFDQQETTNQMLLNKTHEQSRKIKSYQEEISRLRENYKTILKAKQSLMKKHKLLDEVRTSAEMERDALRSVNSHLNIQLEAIKNDLEQTHKQLDTATRERDISQKNFVKSTASSLKQYSVLKLSEQNKRNLEQEISGYKEEAQKMRKLIYSLEKDRDNRLNEINVIGQQLIEKNTEIKIKENDIFDAKKKIIDFEKKSKEQQALYENVRADRNVYSKNLLEAQDEIMELKRKLKIMNHQVDQLKEEISSRETILVKEHFEHSKLEKEKETLLLQIAKLTQQHEEAQKLIQSQQCEENKLRHVIHDADHERIRQKKEFDAVVQERDILGTQLIRRNDELSLLYEKIKIQTSTLNKGEIQYRERVEDIRVLRLEIKKLRREKAMLQTETQNVDGLRGEVFKLQRECLKERTRVKVLEEELESPMNIHRWRKLAGSDPNTFELISKIQTLQKRLIAKTEEVVEKELAIKRQEKLYTDIKNVLKRQPGPEVLQELQIARSAVKVKVRESKALASELNMYHSQVNEYKFDIEKLNRELQDIKFKYFQSRKKLSKLSKVQDKGDYRDTAFEERILPNPPDGPIFSGGGFNMSIPRANIISPFTENNQDMDVSSVHYTARYEESDGRKSVAYEEYASQAKVINKSLRSSRKSTPKKPKSGETDMMELIGNLEKKDNDNGAVKIIEKGDLHMQVVEKPLEEIKEQKEPESSVPELHIEKDSAPLLNSTQEPNQQNTVVHQEIENFQNEEQVVADTKELPKLVDQTELPPLPIQKEQESQSRPQSSTRDEI